MLDKNLENFDEEEIRRRNKKISLHPYSLIRANGRIVNILKNYEIDITTKR